MRRLRIAGAALLMAGCLVAQSADQGKSTTAPKESTPPPKAPPPSAAALKEARHRFNLAATRAAANFRSADSVEANLRMQGATLHPQITALRFRIEASLDTAEQALKDADLATADEETKRAEQMLDKFARLLGGY